MVNQTNHIYQIAPDLFQTTAQGTVMTLTKATESGWELSTAPTQSSDCMAIPSTKYFDTIEEIETRYKSWKGLSLLIKGKARPIDDTDCRRSITQDQLTDREKAVLAEAKTITERLMHRISDVIDSSETVKSLLAHQVGHLPHEVFGVLHLDNAKRVICNEEMFRGSVSEAPVFPREIAKSALLNGSSSVILYHNHPSMFSATPSEKDKIITAKITSTLKAIDVDVLDHVVVAGTETTSFAEANLLPGSSH